MLYQILEYIKFLISSGNQHGIHSPYVYNLVTECFYDKNKFSAYQLISKYRTSLIKNNSIITVNDLGVGSKILKSNSRKVSDISKKAGITNKKGQLLFRIVNYFKPEKILELGTSLGTSTCALSLGNPKSKIITVEGCPETAGVAKSQFKIFDLKNIKLIESEFDKQIKALKTNRFDLIYIDGNHQKEATENYFIDLLETIHNDSVIIFDDIHWSKGMTNAWETIKQNPKVTLTIDTYHWGIVFFRREQVKQHFRIRV